MAEGAKGVRTPRTVFGGRVSADTSRVTLVLLALNVAVFLAGFSSPDLDVRFGNLALAIGPQGLIGVADGEYYRLITAAFLHAGVFHLLMNMFALMTVGPQLEQTLGRARYLALYLLSALGGSTLSYVLSEPGQLGVGASGAIFGLFGAYYVVVRRLGGDTGSILALLAINLVITFAVPIIDWRAHLGGLIVGTVFAAALAYAPRGPRRTPLHVGAGLAVGALLVAVVLTRTGMLT
ncbi:MAG TPA: rhomboid family intramembrane serine protease [Mycobacteriales bacterium]|nr:rhomboid family intramembrane serine protease [Mycobacteriales bacterium]